MGGSEPAYDLATDMPLSANPDSQGTRLFLNALFKADCVTTTGQPSLAVTLAGPNTLSISAAQGSYVVGYANAGIGTALEGELVLELPAGVTVDDAGGGTLAGPTVTFAVGSIGASGTVLPPPASGSRTVVLSFAGEGVYTLTARLGYRVGVTELTAGPALLDVGVGVTPPPRDGGADADGGGGGDGGDAGGDGGGGGGDGGGSGCGCRAIPSAGGTAFVLGLAGVLVVLRRRGRGEGRKKPPMDTDRGGSPSGTCGSGLPRHAGTSAEAPRAPRGATVGSESGPRRT
ncbi:MAG: hypothetical protein HY905_02485 [Deltaproteobacteria bacterium]|nr:hypothetical protein [Deltaproteobacteria bacterium]